MMNIVIRSRRNSSEDEEKKVELMISKLKKCGIPENHCFKSLAATGFVDENLAAEWLVSHVDDPCLLEENSSRVFYLALCPVGDFSHQVEEYWSACQQGDLGWNAAHELPPSIMLFSDFKVPCRKVHSLHVACINVLNNFAQRGELPPVVDLEVVPDEADNCIVARISRTTSVILRCLTESLRQECLKEGVVLEADKAPQELQMMLATDAPAADLAALTQLCRHWVQLGHACRWEARLYSKDPRVGHLWPGYRARMTVEVTEGDSCLAYSNGDFIVTDPAIPAPGEGWRHGFNINTGLSGKFPTLVCERVPHFHTWTLHKSFRLNSSIPSSPASINGEFLYTPLTPNSDQCVFSNGVFEASVPVPPPPAAIQRKGSASGRKSVSDGSSSSSGGGGILRKNSDSALALMTGSWSSSGPRRQLVVMRHGERVDFCFGKMWFSKSFDEKGVYKRLNLNMPAFLPSRLPSDFAMDSPLTQLGMTLAFETGRSLLEGGSGAGVSHCFASPALRCVQTAAQVLRGAGLADSVPIRVEPHLFEWLGWYQVCQPRFMTCAELRDHGFPVDAEYRSVSRFEDLDVQESLERFYERSHKLCKRLLESTKKKGGNLLIVGHAGSLDACTRQLVTGKPVRKKMSDVRRVISRVPYCASVCVEERRVGGRWQYVDPCVLPFTHGLNREFQWKEVVGERRVEPAGVLSAAKDGR